jgi:lysophospholipase
MGSAISLAYVLEHQDELAGLVLSGGGIAKPGEAVPAPPERKPGDPPRPPLSTDFLSNDPQVIEDYVNDPLVYRGPMPDRFAMFEVRETLPKRVGEIRLPILIMAGGAVPDGARSTTLHEYVGSADKTLKVYAGLKHEIFNEREHPQVMADLETWLSSRV